MRRWFAALTLLATLTSPAALAAQDDPRWAEGQRRFAEAQELYEQGNYDGALSEFLEVYELLETHERRFFVLYNTGKCRERLFRYTEAIADYERFLAEGRVWARTTGRPLEKEREASDALTALRARIATFQITVNVDRAEVWVDGALVGHAPGDVLVSEGRHAVELRAAGHAPARQDVQIAARTTQPLSFTLEETLGALSPALFITAAGLTVVAAGIGLVFGSMALAEQSSIDGQLASTDPSERFRVTQARIDANAQTALLADIFFAAAGGLAIASVVLILLTDWGDDSGDTASATVAPWANADGAGLTLLGRF